MDANQAVPLLYLFELLLQASQNLPGVRKGYKASSILQKGGEKGTAAVHSYNVTANERQ